MASFVSSSCLSAALLSIPFALVYMRYLLIVFALERGGMEALIVFYSLLVIVLFSLWVLIIPFQFLRLMVSLVLIYWELYL